MNRELFYVCNYSITAYDDLCEDIYRAYLTDLYKWRTQPQENLSRYFYGKIVNKMHTIAIYSLTIKTWKFRHVSIRWESHSGRKVYKIL